MQPTQLPMVAGVPAQRWDMKALQKFIVMSDAYRQASKTTAEARALDPENRWIARGARLRLQAEFIRDAALSVSGLLVEKLVDQVFGLICGWVWDETSRYGDLRNYKPDTDAGRYRRSMYTIWKRTAAHRRCCCLMLLTGKFVRQTLTNQHAFASVVALK